LFILRRGRAEVTGCEVELSAERAEQDPKVFTRIHVHDIITGPKLDPKKVERAVSLSAEKYCSASIMLGATAEVTHDFEIRDA
jgi:putative redox protein